VVGTFEKVSTKQTNIVFNQIFHSAHECNKVNAFATGKKEENFDKQKILLATMHTLSK